MHVLARCRALLVDCIICIPAAGTLRQPAIFLVAHKTSALIQQNKSRLWRAAGRPNADPTTQAYCAKSMPPTRHKRCNCNIASALHHSARAASSLTAYPQSNRAMHRTARSLLHITQAPPPSPTLLYFRKHPYNHTALGPPQHAASQRSCCTLTNLIQVNF